MMKPDFKVTIAYGTSVSGNLAKKIYEKLLDMRSKGYPVIPQMLFEDGDPGAISSIAHRIFSDFDFVIFIFDVKGLAKIPRDGRNLEISPMLDLSSIEGATVPFLSPNLILELGMTWATNIDDSTRLSFTMGGNFYAHFPTDFPMPIMPSLDEFDNDDKKIDFIIKKLHQRLHDKLISDGCGYLKESYSSEIPRTLTVSDYRPVLQKLISKPNLKNLNSLATYSSPLDEYFLKEYELFGRKNNVYTINRRIQYLIDRAVFFVYLRNSLEISGLLDILEEDCRMYVANDEQSFYLDNINLLREVMKYHGLMIKSERNFKAISDSLSNIKRNFDRREINCMAKCLIEDYLGLSLHKVALSSLASIIDEKFFNPIDKNHILKLKKKLKELQGNSIIDTAKDELNQAVDSFRNVVSTSTMKGLENGYIWNGYALYNQSRCEYLLYCLGAVSAKTWEEHLLKSIDIREEYYVKYENANKNEGFPAVIAYSLHAEYFHARLEYLHYLVNEGKAKEVEIDTLEKEISKWANSSTFYNDTLGVDKKLKELKERLKE